MIFAATPPGEPIMRNEPPPKIHHEKAARPIGSDQTFRRVVAGCLLLTAVLLFIAPNHWVLPDPFGDARRIAQIGAAILAVFGLIFAFRRPSGDASGLQPFESGLVLMSFGVGIGVVGWLLMQQKEWLFLGTSALIGAGLVTLIGFGRAVLRR
jgi:hypothetical protein